MRIVLPLLEQFYVHQKLNLKDGEYTMLTLSQSSRGLSGQREILIELTQHTWKETTCLYLISI
jgi:hypothetical protein